uniref:Uncharacterized protein n=1 Tax=Sphingobacterium sp. (strain 21) TaxID=743722 RepID=F4C8S8_SPHS2
MWQGLALRGRIWLIVAFYRTVIKIKTPPECREGYLWDCREFEASCQQQDAFKVSRFVIEKYLFQFLGCLPVFLFVHF